MISVARVTLLVRRWLNSVSPVIFSGGEWKVRGSSSKIKARTRKTWGDTCGRLCSHNWGHQTCGTLRLKEERERDKVKVTAEAAPVPRRVRSQKSAREIQTEEKVAAPISVHSSWLKLMLCTRQNVYSCSPFSLPRCTSSPSPSSEVRVLWTVVYYSNHCVD